LRFCHFLPFCQFSEISANFWRFGH
jgi:hypothetical protein